MQQEKNPDGELSFREADLYIGSSMEGKISSLKWFDWRSAPLVTFDNGSENVGVYIDETKYSTVNVSSNNKMQSFGGRLTQQRVAITSGDKTAYISLLSYDYFSRLTQFAVDSELVNGAPPINEVAVANGGAYGSSFNMLAASGLHQTSNFFISSAYAYDLGFWDVVEIVGSLVGLDSVGVIWDQLGNMVAGRDVDVVAFSVAVLDLLTLFPPAAPLRVAVIPAKLAIRVMRLGNAKATQYLAGVLKKMYDKAKKRDFDLVFQGIATFIILADMYQDEEAREGIKVLASTINSTDDFINWLDFISLADPELVEETAYNLQQPTEVYADNPLSWIMGSAYAKKGSIKAGEGKKLGKSLKNIESILAKADNPAQSLGSIAKIIRQSPALVKTYVPLIFNKDMLFSFTMILGKGSVQKMRGYLTNYNGRRIPPLTMILIVSYLEQQVEDNKLFNTTAGDQNVIDRNKENIAELRKLYASAVPAMIAGSKSGGQLVNIAHGASFHLLELAKQQLAGSNVIGLETRRLVKIFNTEAARIAPIHDQTRHIERKIDILTGTWKNAETWIEVKSWRSVSKTNLKPKQKIGQTRWVYDNAEDKTPSTKGSAHRQFITDRIAKHRNAKFVSLDIVNKYGDEGHGRAVVPYIKVDDIQWKFHKFVAGVKKDILNPSEKYLRDPLKREPTGSKTGKGAGAFTAQVGETVNAAEKYINLTDMIEFMELMAKNHTSELIPSVQDELRLASLKIPSS